MTHAIELQQARRVFGSVVALGDVSLAIAPGEFFALLGPSGSGKKTCLRLIAGFDQPSAGEILIHGSPATGVPPYERDVNTVFQDYALFPHLSIFENVAFGLRRQGVGDDVDRRVNEMLDLVQLSHAANRRPRQLSGGQQQRVAIARALLKNPRILIFDEATSALDSKSEKAIQAELERAAQGRTTLVIAHRLSTVMDASQILVLAQGRIIERGTHAELLAARGEYARMWSLQQQAEAAEAVLERAKAA